MGSRSTPVYRYLTAHIALRPDLTFTSLAKRLGVSRTTLWRRLTTLPWVRDRPHRGSEPLLEALAAVLQDTKDKLLWLAGYNPFVAKDLSPRQLYLLYEITARIARLVAERRFGGDVNALAALALQELADRSKEANEYEPTSGDRHRKLGPTSQVPKGRSRPLPRA